MAGATSSTADDASSSSESTTEVFFEMLGLPVLDVGDISSAIEDEHEPKVMCSVGTETHTNFELPQQIKCNSNSSTLNREDREPVVSFLEVPNKCSRYLHRPQSVAAFMIEELFTASECRTLIQLAEEMSFTGFHYVTEASHTDNEGMNEVYCQ